MVFVISEENIRVRKTSESDHMTPMNHVGRRLHLNSLPIREIVFRADGACLARAMLFTWFFNARSNPIPIHRKNGNTIIWRSQMIRDSESKRLW